MLTLVLADNFLLLYVVWELVGVCSYLLIGFWYERRSAAEAAKKAFVTTRIGDVGLLVGILLLFREVGTFDMSTTFEVIASGAVGEGTVTIAAILLFLGAMGKSAPVPVARVAARRHGGALSRQRADPRRDDGSGGRLPGGPCLPDLRGGSRTPW